MFKNVIAKNLAILNPLWPYVTKLEQCGTLWKQMNVAVMATTAFKFCSQYTVYMRIFHAYFFWNLVKKNWGARII